MYRARVMNDSATGMRRLQVLTDGPLACELCSELHNRCTLIGRHGVDLSLG